MKLSEYVINYRKRMGISLRKFAERCGLSGAYISMLENERNPQTGKPLNPTLDTLAKLANGMGITLQKLMEDVDDCMVDLAPAAVEHRQDEVFLQSMSDDERTLFRLAKTARPEAVRAAVAVLRSMEETNHDF